MYSWFPQAGGRMEPRTQLRPTRDTAMTEALYCKLKRAPTATLVEDRLVVQFAPYTNSVILSAAVFQA